MKFGEIEKFSPNSSESDLITMANLLETYHNLSLNELNLDQYFHNIGMFLKISSGAYSFEKREIREAHEMYCMGSKYEYVDDLARIP